MTIEAVRGYTLTRPFTTAGGGQCRWTFAERDGREYFLKEFLAPTYPLPDGPGSAETKERKLVRCQKFEDHHRTITGLLKPLSVSGGNLVVTENFFREGAHYYKTTAKIDVSTASPQEIARLPLEQLFQLLLTAAFSLDILHRSKLVHGDIKPANILAQQAGRGLSAKLIDFDSCYVDRRPPDRQEMVGDPVYYAPEMTEYIVGEGSPDRLTVQADIFALGLVFSEYVFGRLPDIDGGHRYPGEALLHGANLDLGPADDPARRTGEPVWSALGELIALMLRRNPADRPTCGEIHRALKRIRVNKDPHTVLRPAAPAPAPTPVASPAAEPPVPAPEPEEEAGKLRGFRFRERAERGELRPFKRKPGG